MTEEYGKRKRFVDLFLKKDGKIKPDAETASATDKQEEAAEEGTVSPEIGFEVPRDPYSREVDPGGVAMKLWHKWEKHPVPKPLVSVACAGREQELFPNAAELTAELDKMMLNVDRDTRRALAIIEEVEKLKESRQRALEETRRNLVEQAAAEARERGENLTEEQIEELRAGVQLDETNDEPALNAICHVYTARNAMVAWMFMIPPWGEGGTLERATLDQALTDNGVVFGIDQDALDALFEAKQYFRLTPVAFGTPPVEGENGRIVEHFLRELPKEVRVDEHGKADYRAEYLVQAVEQGEVICDIIPPVEGTPGQGVNGQPVAPQKVTPAKVPSGANTTITPDGTQMIATRAGHVEFGGGVFTVKPVLEINGDVDYSTGNIDFRGDVHIHGDVREHFSVHATGSVTIDGLVEAANVEAGGNIMISCGVLGDNRALIKSGGRLQAKYLENCVAYASESIAADCIMASQTYSDGTIEVMTGRGTIIGGSLIAAKSVKARIIGCQNDRVTEITLGALPYVQNEMIDIETDLVTVQMELEALERDLKYLASQDGMDGNSEKTAKARLRKSVLTMKEQKLLKQKEKLGTMTPDLSKCRLEASTVYPSTSVTVQGYIWRANEIRNSCKLTYDVKLGEIRDV